MKLPDLFFWLLLIGGSYLAFVAYWLAAVAFFAPAVERARLTYATRPVGATAVGLGVLLPALVLSAILKGGPPPVKILVLALLCLLLLLALIGSAGLADKLGAGLSTPADATQPWRRVLRGGAVLGLLFVAPVLGWFVLPLTLASGLGAFILSRWTTPALSTRIAPAIAEGAAER